MRSRSERCKLFGFSAFVGWSNRFGRSDGFQLRFDLRPPAPARSGVPRGRRGGARRGGERAARRAWWRRNRGRGGGRSCPGPWARAPPPAGARSGARCGRSCETMAFASGRPLSRWLVIPSRAITPADAVLGRCTASGPAPGTREIAHKGAMVQWVRVWPDTGRVHLQSAERP